MSGLQGCAPDLWPALSILALLVFLGSYSWRRRNVRGATPFAFACLFGALWVVGAIGEISATDFAGKKFWVEYQAVCQLPTATAICCFVLAYAGLGRWLTRRNLSLLALPCVLVVVAVVSNDVHHLQWTTFRMEAQVVPSLGPLGWAFISYAYMLGLVNFFVLLWFAIRFPQHRWPVGIMLLGQFIGRGWIRTDSPRQRMRLRSSGPSVSATCCSRSGRATASVRCRSMCASTHAMPRHWNRDVRFARLCGMRRGRSM